MNCNSGNPSFLLPKGKKFQHSATWPSGQPSFKWEGGFVHKLSASVSFVYMDHSSRRLTIKTKQSNKLLLPSAISCLFSLWKSCTVLFCQFGALDKTHAKENITGLKYTPTATSLIKLLIVKYLCFRQKHISFAIRIVAWCLMAWENSQHFVNPPLVSPTKWHSKMCGEIHYC